MLVEIGDEALPSLRDSKARLEEYLSEELKQRAHDAAAYGATYDPPPVQRKIMSVKTAIDFVINEIEGKGNKTISFGY